jgi:uncharacterized protein (DUF433 family)
MNLVPSLPDYIDTSKLRPVVRGTDIKVSQIASEYDHEGMNPDEIAQAHPHLGLAEIHAALTYYYSHQDEIRRDWQETNQLIAALRNQYPSRRAAKTSDE